MDIDSSQPLPTVGRLAGIDFGTARVGVSLSDPSQTWVTPLGTYQRRNAELDAQYFNRLAESEGVVGFVVGLPIHCDGNESQKSKEARRFACEIGRWTDKPVAMFDERFTTAEARQLLGQSEMSGRKKKSKLDGLAAHLILTHYLDSQRNATSDTRQLD